MHRQSQNCAARDLGTAQVVDTIYSRVRVYLRGICTLENNVDSGYCLQFIWPARAVDPQTLPQRTVFLFLFFDLNQTTIFFAERQIRFCWTEEKEMCMHQSFIRLKILFNLPLNYSDIYSVSNSNLLQTIVSKG